MSDDNPSSADPVGRIADEFVEAFRQGKRPSVEEFARRYPGQADEIRDMLPALLLVEQAKSADDPGQRRQVMASAAAPLRQLGDYQILREVGRGGMGVVYEAVQGSLGRHVALKVLPAHAHLDPRQLGRFQREARSAARLHHTNIVPVFGVGERDGLPYYVMQFIQGKGLDAVLTELRRLRKPKGQSALTEQARPPNTRDLSAAEVAQSLLTGAFQPGVAVPPEDPTSPAGAPRRPAGEVALVGPVPPEAAVSPAGGHAGEPAGPTRTDPAVHLPGQSETDSLTESGRGYWVGVARVGVQVAQALEYAASQGVLHRDIKPSNLLLDGQGNVWVTDFGLAKGEADADNLTHTGDIVGTLRYMAPERFSGRGDVRSDVYSLGLTLYEMLTLRPAFDEADRNKLVRQVMHDEPVRPRKLDPAVPRDLETVVLKAIARDPAHRYQTPAEMAADLQRFIEDRPVKARRVSDTEKFLRWCRRNPLPAALLAAIVLVFLTGFAGVFWQWRVAETARDNEKNQRTRAELLREVAEGDRARAEREEANAKAAKGRADLARYFSSFVRAQMEYRDNNFSDAEAILDRCPPEYRGWEWRFLKQLCHADLFTKDGHTGWVRAVAYSPDGKLLASAGGGNPFAHVQGPASVRPGEVILRDAATGAHVRTLRGHRDVATAVAFSPDGKWLASGSDDSTARVWDVATGKELRALRVSRLPEKWPHRRNTITCLAFSPDGKTLATGSHKIVDFWDLTDDRPGPPASKRTLGDNDKDAIIAGIAFSPDGHRLAVGAYHAYGAGELHVLDLPGGKETLKLEAMQGVERGVGVAFSPDGRYLAASQPGDLIKLWDAGTGRLLQTIAGHKGVVNGVAFSPDGRQLASAGADGTARVWSVPAGAEVRLFRGHRGNVHGVAFSPDGMRLASASIDGTVKVWDLTLHPEYCDVLGAREVREPEALTFAEQGKRLVVACRGGLVRTLDYSPHWQVGILPRVGLTSTWLTPAESACLDADGRLLAGICADDAKTAACWDVRTGQERVRLRGHALPLWCVTLSRGGSRIATGARPPRAQPPRLEVKVWDGANGRALLELDEANLTVTRLALSPGGDRLALAAMRGIPVAGGKESDIQAILRVYDVGRQKIIRSFAEGADPYFALAFSDDGSLLAAAGASKRTVLVWNLEEERPAVTNQGPEGALDVAFSPDGRRLAVASRLMIKLLDTATGEDRLILRGMAHARPTTHGFNPRVRFSPDGKRIAAICHDIFAPVSTWSVEEEGAGAAAARMQAAERRAVSTHIQAAFESQGDPKPRARYHFHLKRLEGLTLISPEEYLARGALYLRDGRRGPATADFVRATELAMAGHGAGEQGVDTPAAGAGERPGAWGRNAPNVSEDRAARMVQSVEWLRKAEPVVSGLTHKAALRFFLSLAYTRLGRVDEAKAACRQGLQLLDKIGPQQGYYYSWPWCGILHPEADAALKGHKPAAKP